MFLPHEEMVAASISTFGNIMFLPHEEMVAASPRLYEIVF
jgi:hypothetical protein